MKHGADAQGKIESVLESQWNAALLLGGSVVLWGLALTAGAPAWAEYGHLFDESKLVHITTLDFMLLTAFAPFWMWNDAQLRNWEPRCVHGMEWAYSGLFVHFSHKSHTVKYQLQSEPRCSLMKHETTQSDTPEIIPGITPRITAEQHCRTALATIIVM